MRLREHIHLVARGGMGLSGAGDCNVYAIESQGDILLIDCGLSPDPEKILCNLREDGLDPGNIRGVLLTHVHPDHAGAVPAFQKMGVPILCGDVSARILREGLSSYYRMDTLPDSGFHRFLAATPQAEADRILEDGEEIQVGDLKVQMHVLPAHTPDSVCYSLKLGRDLHLFTGDTLFYPGHINHFAYPLSLAAGYPEVIRRLAAMAPEGLYPGHAMFTVARAKQCTDAAMECIKNGTLPPTKSYS